MACEVAWGRATIDRAIVGGKVPEMARLVAPALRERVEGGWATDPQDRLTMARVGEASPPFLPGGREGGCGGPFESTRRHGGREGGLWRAMMRG
jgi:hypothetical protein